MTKKDDPKTIDGEPEVLRASHSHGSAGSPVERTPFGSPTLDIEAIRETYNNARKRLGCGDSLCLFVPPTGQQTNGGCRCIRLARPGAAGALAALFREVGAALGEEGDDD